MRMGMGGWSKIGGTMGGGLVGLCMHLLEFGDIKLDGFA